MMTTMTMLCIFIRCFSDVKTAVRISIATGLTTKPDLETCLENSGLVCSIDIEFVIFSIVPLQIYFMVADSTLKFRWIFHRFSLSIVFCRFTSMFGCINYETF